MGLIRIAPEPDRETRDGRLAVVTYLRGELAAGRLETAPDDYLKPRHGGASDADMDAFDGLRALGEAVELKDHVGTLQAHCRVCGVGAIFLGTVAVHDRFKVAGLPGFDERYRLERCVIETAVARWFDLTTLALIEVEFMANDRFIDCCDTTTTEPAIVDAAGSRRVRERRRDDFVERLVEELALKSRRGSLLPILDRLERHDGEFLVDESELGAWSPPEVWFDAKPEVD